jgi:DNA-binding XRE family transcriptional regulator
VQEKTEQGYDFVAIQCRMARAATELGVRDLAKLAGVSPDTIARMERGEVVKPATKASIQTALENAGIEFIGENGGGVGVRLKKP